MTRELADPLKTLHAAATPREAVAAVDFLRAELWAGMTSALREPAREDLVELSDRLGRLCATLTQAALPAPPSAAGEPASTQEARTADATALGQRPLIDERDAMRDRPGPERPLARPERVEASLESGLGGGPDEIALRDKRPRAAARESPITMIARAVSRFERDRRPFAVLLFELRDLPALAAVTAPPELVRLGDSLARALAELLARERPSTEGRAGAEGPLAERPGRLWTLEPGLEPAAARRIADRVGTALPTRLGSWAEVVAGVAGCPANARDATGLAAHADIDLYAARRPAAPVY